jgi:hypothetical protein
VPFASGIEETTVPLGGSRGDVVGCLPNRRRLRNQHQEGSVNDDGTLPLPAAATPGF